MRVLLQKSLTTRTVFISSLSSAEACDIIQLGGQTHFAHVQGYFIITNI